MVFGDHFTYVMPGIGGQNHIPATLSKYWGPPIDPSVPTPMYSGMSLARVDLDLDPTQLHPK